MPLASHVNRKWVIVPLIGLLIVVAGFYAITYIGAEEPPEATACECDLLQSWVIGLPLTPGGDHLAVHEVTVIEGVNGFLAGGSGMQGVLIDRGALVDTLTANGFNHKTIVNRPGMWNVAFYPGAAQFDGPWSFEIISTEDAVGVRVRVTVDGSPWGLETIEDLHDLYRTEPETARTVLEERQRKAITILRSLQQALQSIVEDD